MAERLYRSRRKRVVAGVAGGLGEYINIDPVIIRVLFVIFTIINPLTLLAYIILWIVVQEEPYEDPPFEMNSSYASAEETSSHNENESYEKTNDERDSDLAGKNKAEGRGRTIAGIILIAIGFILLVDEWFPRFDFADIFPYILVLGGIWLVFKSVNKNEKIK